MWLCKIRTAYHPVLGRQSTWSFRARIFDHLNPRQAQLINVELRGSGMADAKSTPSYSSDLHFSVFQNRPDRGLLIMFEKMFKKFWNKKKVKNGNCPIKKVWQWCYMFVCLKSLGTKLTLHLKPTLQNYEPVPQDLKQVVKLSCFLYSYNFYFLSFAQWSINFLNDWSEMSIKMVKLQQLDIWGTRYLR